MLPVPSYVRNHKIYMYIYYMYKIQHENDIIISSIRGDFNEYA